MAKYFTQPGDRGENAPEMSFLDHLEELRWHIVKGIIGLLVAAVL